MEGWLTVVFVIQIKSLQLGSLKCIKCSQVRARYSLPSNLATGDLVRYVLVSITQTYIYLHYKRRSHVDQPIVFRYYVNV